ARGRSGGKGGETRLVRRRRGGVFGAVPPGFPRCKGGVGRWLAREPLRQRLDGVVVAVVIRLFPADRDDGALRGGSARCHPIGTTDLIFRGIFLADRNRWLVLRSDIAAINRKVSIGVDADEHPGTRDLGRCVANRTILEG